ncbi:type IV pilin [Haloterrigena alkaliphila]|uniref:Type IV pilin N-terminal domain-containing protein n=1 Tax=Haloterrigena alkaliphila TaxID=2816475 RepID=A0A8A2VG68_9EURY|nr:type IV pilin N-terminal domain-containing protein [Haloterrigena alkaliphila]QSX01134.1 type IV pilin N-terminal domain-containing protein [Haloterrigena alkaliphila]
MSRPLIVRESDQRGISPVVGLIALVALTVCLAAAVAVGVGTVSLEASGPTAAFDLTANGTESSIVVEHRSGDPIDVSALSVTIAVNGERLDEQPPVPFVGARGFDGTPDGPFNARADSEWRAGERAGIVVAGTNDPEIDSGDTITVTLAVDGYRVAALETTAR